MIYDFSQETKINDWMIVDDVVMGGRSNGSIKLNAEGQGVFEGIISLANNGGFSSVRHRPEQIKVGDKTRIIIRLKGDGKEYQFRVKSSTRDYYSYLGPFTTSGEWQEIEIPLASMYPAFRGRKLDLPNFSEDFIEEITFLIGNKKAESFKLLIDWIELR